MGILHQGLGYQLDLPVAVGTEAMNGIMNAGFPELSSSFVKHVKGVLIREVGSRKEGSVTTSYTQTSSKNQSGNVVRVPNQMLKEEFKICVTKPCMPITLM